MKRIKPPGQYFVCISWHGPSNLNNKKEKLKEKLLEDLLQYVDLLSKDLEISVVMGGDFNISTEEALGVIKNRIFSLEIFKSADEPIIYYVVSKGNIFKPENVEKIKKNFYIDDIFIHCPVRLKIKMAVDTLPFKILTMNANGIPRYTKERETAIQNLVRKEKSHVILFQECIVGMNFWENDEFRDYEYIGSCKNHASILYNKQELSCEISFHTDTDCQGIIKYRLDINADKPLIDFINRILTKHSDIQKHCLCMSKMRRKKVPSQQEFVCISWHSQDNHDVDKQKLLEDLLQTVDKWSKEYKIPVVMGGDFNISYTEAEKVIKEKKLSLTILKSENEVMIYFVVTKDSIFDTLSDFEKTIKKEKELLNDNVDIFDHNLVKFELNDNANTDSSNVDSSEIKDDNSSKSKDEE
ncbi:uncharacterized protein LOC128237263 [Mya arenaria]|uniref:uncharacterized protein LOC128237263 n=1 Tax=Mya arenaria TaxID=6604 RepID=UPI0022E50612|nr:uncharacterized protein LOC128237263 [Mya arenaria]